MLSVKQLASLAGISRRTLHYYDEFGLLKPSQVGENGYRYYDYDALLRLQQILLYREIDIPLNDIRQIMSEPGFDLEKALISHKSRLQTRITHLEHLVAMVDHTIQHLEGKKEMSQKQLFEAFSDEKQAAYEQEVIQVYDPETVKASIRKWNSYSSKEKQQIADEGNAVYSGFLATISKGPASPEAQLCVERWRRHMDYFWTPEVEQLVLLAHGYNNDPRFRANFDSIDPGLAPFVLEAVQIYVEKLST